MGCLMFPHALSCSVVNKYKLSASPLLYKLKSFPLQLLSSDLDFILLNLISSFYSVAGWKLVVPLTVALCVFVFLDFIILLMFQFLMILVIKILGKSKRLKGISVEKEDLRALGRLKELGR